MKLVLFCPQITEVHQAISSLEARGYRVLRSETADEARVVAELHRDALSAVVIHRESTSQAHDGVGVDALRSLVSVFSDRSSTRLILTSHDWSDADLSSQSGLSGVVFLKWPFDSEALVNAIEKGAASEMTQLVATPEPELALTGSIRLDADHLNADLNLVTAPSISLESLSEAVPESSPESSSIELETAPLDLLPESPAIDELPYLEKPSGWNPAASFAQPLEDAVVPGGAAHAPDLETLKKYLLLREQDVAALSSQLRAARSQISELEKTLRLERGKNHDLSHSEKQLKEQLQGVDGKHQEVVSALQNEISQLQFTLKTRSDRAKLLEAEMKKVSDDMESLKDRVRYDIRRIQVNEKELANRIEIIKKDSEVLLSAREVKIIELKRKVDLLEFNMDLLQSQYSKEKEKSKLLQERLDRASQMLKVAGGFLDKPSEKSTDSDAA